MRLRPDLVVSDVMMPGLSGDDAGARDAARAPSSKGSPSWCSPPRPTTRSGCACCARARSDYLNKPFFAEELRARVRNLVSMKRAREILQRDLLTRTRDLESLAGEVALHRRELITALESAKVARDHADRASAMKTSFLRMVSHELRTPLTSLKLNLERLARTREVLSLAAVTRCSARSPPPPTGSTSSSSRSSSTPASRAGRLRVDVEET